MLVSWSNEKEIDQEFCWALCELLDLYDLEVGDYNDGWVRSLGRDGDDDCGYVLGCSESRGVTQEARGALLSVAIFFSNSLYILL